MPPERRLAAIMFTDIVGSTAATARSETTGLELRDRHRTLVRAQVRRYHGRFVEAPGDESLSAFDSALNAVNCALAIQEELESDPDLALHIGVHLGEIVFRGEEVFGGGVNVASRICSLAPPGETYVSSVVADALQGQQNIESSPRGEHKLKGVERPVSVSAVSGTAAQPSVAARITTREARGRWITLGTVAIVVAIAGFVWWSYRPAATPGPIRSLAVLPLANLSGDPEQDYIVSGMHDQLITSLARIGGNLRVISRTSVVRIDQTGKTTPEIAAELGVDGIIEGSAMREGDRVLVTLQLIDARTDGHVWAESYERPFGGMISLSREISRTVADEVRVVLSPEREGLLAAGVDPAALELYLLGMEQLRQANRERAAELFQAAIDVDPGFAHAFVGLGTTYRIRMEGGLSPDQVLLSAEEGQPPLRAALERAIELDGSLGAAHSLLALSRWESDHDWSKAERGLTLALEIEPSAARTMTSLAQFLSAAGRHREALAMADRAVTFDPLDPNTHNERVARLVHARQFQRAIEEGNRLLEPNPVDPAFYFVRGQVAHALAALGEDEAAHRSFVELRRAAGRDTDGMERAYQLGGLQASATEVLAELRNEGRISHFGLAIYACLAEKPEEALAELSRASLETPDMLLIGTWPGLDCVRSDPRFQELLRKINWPGLDD